MRSAEEWIEEADFVEGPDWNYAHKAFKDFVERIQSDAHTAGQEAMRDRAGGLCDQVYEHLYTGEGRGEVAMLARAIRNLPTEPQS